jgi:Uma2 family endonuclease
VDEFEQFLRQPENVDRLLELFNGEILEKMPTEQHGMIVMNIGAELTVFVKKYKLGRVGTEVRHRHAKDRQNSLLPDLSFTSGQRTLVTEGSVTQMPDLAIGIKSPDDTLKQLRDKAAYYLANGSRLVWLVVPGKRYVEIHRPDQEEEIVFGSDVLDGEDVLPGFTLPVSEVFADHLGG